MGTNTAAEIGARIRRARENQGLSQSALAEAVGKTQTAISYWEAGRRSPDVDDLVVIAGVLDVEVPYFFELTRPPRAGVLLRAEATLRPFDNLISEIEKFAARAEGLPPLPADVQIRSENPTTAAQKLLAMQRVTAPPVDVEQLCASCGIHVMTVPFSDEISGLLLELERNTVIGVNQRHPLVRRRFTVAHELGHFILDHHDHFHIDLSDPSAHGERPGFNWVDERNANDFAAQLLMPASMVVLAYEATPDVERLAKTFKVSREAMGWRLVNLGVLS